MGKNIVMAVVLCCLTVPKIIFCNELGWQELGGGNTDIQTFFVYPGRAGLMFFGSNKGLYRSGDSGKSWKNVLWVKGRDKPQAISHIRYLVVDPKNDHLYLATKSGIYKSQNNAESWDKFTDYGLLSKEGKVSMV